jgi:hypothetical protein
MAVNRHCLQYTVYDDDRRVTRSLALCVCFVDRCLSFCTFSFGYCVVCSSSIYRFWLPLWYLQTLLSCSCFHRLLNYLLFTYFAFERISLMLFQKLIALNLISKFSSIKPEHPETTMTFRDHITSGNWQNIETWQDAEIYIFIPPNDYFVFMNICRNVWYKATSQNTKDFSSELWQAEGYTILLLMNLNNKTSICNKNV